MSSDPRIILSCNLFQAFVENGRKEGFWAIRDGWGNSCAKITSVEKANGRAPYYGNPEMTGVLYRLDDGSVVRDPYERFSPGRGGWHWMQPPTWSKEPDVDPFSNRQTVHVPFHRNTEAKKLGATWSDLFGLFWVDQRDHDKVARLGKAGLFDPLPPNVYYDVTLEEKMRLKEIGGRWDPDRKLWYLAGDRFEEIAIADGMGLRRI